MKAESSSSQTALRSALQEWTSLVGLFGLLGIVGSLVANGVVFSIWGLNFFQIASPSDLLLSGSYFVASVIVLTLFTAFIAIAYAVLVYFSEKFSIKTKGGDYAKLDNDTRPLTLLITMALSPLGFVFFSAYDVTWGGLARTDYTVSQDLLLSLALYTEGAIGSLVLYLIYGKHQSVWFKSIGKSLKNIRFFFFTIFFVSAINLIVFSFSERPSWTVEGEQNPCKNFTVAIWIGSETVVARCEDRFSPIKGTDAYLMFPRDGLHFKSIR